jgi:glycosyltransferase involved in cell wall biosynthesis
LIKRAGKVKILWIKAGGVVPLDAGGKIRSYHILRELSQQHEVTLFTFYPGSSDGMHGELRKTLSQVICVPLKLHPFRSLRGFADYIGHTCSPLPYSMAKYYRPEVFRSFADLIGSNSYDLWLCDFVYPAGLIPWDMPVPKVIFAHNVESQVWQRYARVTRNPLWKIVAWREHHAMAKAERHYVRRVDQLVTVSELDRTFFSQYIDPSRISVIRTGVDADYFQPFPADERPNRLVFTGSVDWLPNHDGVSYLLKELLPLIRSAIPETTLCIAGRNPPPDIKALARDCGAEVTGWVEDIRSYMRQAAVCVVPLRVGGGTRLKIFEAMAMGKAIVSTSIGAEGLPVKNGENIIIQDDPRAFANEVIRLLRDQQARLRLGRAARETVESRYTWKAAAEEFNSALRRAVA